MAEILWADYSYSRPDPILYAGVMRYLPTGGKRPDLTRDEVDRLHRIHKPVGLIWQTGTSEAAQGFARGVEDATRAEKSADDLGAPLSAAIFYTVDSDLAPAKVAPYFDGVKATARRPVGIYGSHRIVEWAATYGIPYRWQTLAWSKGQVSEHAHLYQRDHNVNDGSGVLDRNVFLGQFPAWGPTPTTQPDPPPTPGEEQPMSLDTDLKALGWLGTPAARKQSVEDFQRGWNLGPALTVDGKAGPKTLAAIAQSLARKAKGLGTASEHFSFTEFQCNCGDGGRTIAPGCRRIWQTRQSIRALEEYRAEVGPLTITRGCRCPRENKRVGGVSDSRHLYGDAADVEVYEVPVEHLFSKRLFSGVGYYVWKGKAYPRHVDNRPSRTTASPAKWNYGNAKSAPRKPRPDLAATPPKVTPPPAPTPAPAPKPAPVTPKEDDDMPTVHDIWTGTTLVKDVTAPDPETAPRVTPSFLLEVAAGNSVRNAEQIATLTAAVAAISDALSKITTTTTEEK